MPPEKPVITADLILPYKQIHGLTLHAHCFFPPGPAPEHARAAFLFFHGGGWVEGEAAWGYPWCAHFASLGMIALSFEYRLAVLGGLTPLESVRDAFSALRWTRRQAQDMHIDPRRIAACGFSAGAYLAACTALLPGCDEVVKDLPTDHRPNALALISAPVDVEQDAWFLQLLGGAQSAAQCSPARHVRPGLPPALLFHAERDAIVPLQSAQNYQAAMTAAGNWCQLRIFPGLDHFFGGAQSTARSQIRAEMEVFFRQLSFLG